MRKYAEKLVNALPPRKGYERCGNHMVMFSNPEKPPTYYTTYLDDKTSKWVEVRGATRSFLYHGNVIFIVNDVADKYWLSHAGYFTSSTTQAINSYKEYFNRLGYKCMTT